MHSLTHFSKHIVQKTHRQTFRRWTHSFEATWQWVPALSLEYYIESGPSSNENGTECVSIVCPSCTHCKLGAFHQTENTYFCVCVWFSSSMGLTWEKKEARSFVVDAQMKYVHAKSETHDVLCMVGVWSFIHENIAELWVDLCACAVCLWLWGTLGDIEHIHFNIDQYLWGRRHRGLYNMDTVRKMRCKNMSWHTAYHYRSLCVCVSACV